MAVEFRSISFQNQSQHLTRVERVGIWIHDHPTTTKVLVIAALIFGIGLLASLPFTTSTLSTGLVVSLVITGILLTLASYVALFALDLIVPPHHDMENHVYKPGQCDGGKLYYEGDVPVLSLDSDEPFKAGKAHGYLCGDAINRIYTRFVRMLHILVEQPNPDQLPNTLAQMRQLIPSEYVREMEGMVEGYNQWAQEQHGWQAPRKITVDDILLVHLIPDLTHFNAKVFEGELPAAVTSQSAVACSAIVDRDPQNGFVFARNMDWLSFGIIGTYSLVVNRKHSNGLHNTVDVGIPGFAGTLTGMNSQGLSLAMNVCSGNTKEMLGMPAALYNRVCLEQCQTVDEVKAFTRNQSPLGAYHLTVVDRTKAESIHFYQSPQNTHLFRTWQEDQPLSTLNYRYNPSPDDTPHPDDKSEDSEEKCKNFNNSKRQEMLDDFFKHRENRPLEDILSLPLINNFDTTHRVVMEPQTGRFRVAFDNAFAGKAPLHEVPTQRLLKNLP